MEHSKKYQAIEWWNSLPDNDRAGYKEYYMMSALCSDSEIIDMWEGEGCPTFEEQIKPESVEETLPNDKEREGFMKGYDYLKSENKLLIDILNAANAENERLKGVNDVLLSACNDARRYRMTTHHGGDILLRILNDAIKSAIE